MTQTLNQSVAVKKELSRKVKFSIYWSIYLYILILIYFDFIDSKTFSQSLNPHKGLLLL